MILPINLRAALVAAGAIGRAAHRVRPVMPAPADVAELFGHATPIPHQVIAREMSGLRYQNQLLARTARWRGTQILEPYVDADSLERLTPFHSTTPAIFLTWHVGPPFALLGAFGRLGLDVLAIRRTEEYQAPSVHVASVDRGSHSRTKAASHAVARLRRGGLVVIAGDGTDTSETFVTPCLGRCVRMARGPFALARICGVPLVPLLASCDRDGLVRVTVGEPLNGEGSGRERESALAVAAGRWLEAYLLTSPSQLRRCSLRWLLDAPRQR